MSAETASKVVLKLRIAAVFVAVFMLSALAIVLSVGAPAGRVEAREGACTIAHVAVDEGYGVSATEPRRLCP